MTLNSLAFWKGPCGPDETATCRIDELNYKINDKITVLSSYSGASHKREGLYIKASVSEKIQDGDFLAIIISAPKGVERKFPDGFQKIIGGVKHRKLAMGVAGRIWREGDPTSYMIEKLSKSCFINLLTIRGPRKAIDAKAHITAGFMMEDLVTPRVDTHQEGVVIYAFAWDRDRSVSIPSKEKVACVSNKHGGLIVGARSADGSTSAKCKAKCIVTKSYAGDDISMAVSLY